MRTSALLLAGLILVGCNPHRSPDHSTGPTRPSPPAVAKPEPPKPRLTDLPTGPAPRVAYVMGYVHVAPDGRRTRLPGRRGVMAVAPLGAGFMVQDGRNFEGYTGLALVIDRRRVRGWSSAGAPAISWDRVAWGEATSSEASVQPPPAIFLADLDAEPGQWLRQRVAVHPSVAGILGDEVIFNEMFHQGAWISDLVAAPRRIPGVHGVVDVDEVNRRLLSIVGRRRPVVTDLDGSALWPAPSGSLRLSRFDPDGTKVAAVGGHGHVAVFMAQSGKPVGDWVLPPGSYTESLTWEANGDLLACVSQRRQTAIVRLRTDGVIELATPVIRSDFFGADYALVATR